ncbi:hypothetical protein J2785_007384 [Burkholderia ambifaria]|nr:hypothetical protein [Burkholderia ambifaria]MDR6504187.1 hypothetical protein [Burkholderia ambifaria]
MKSTTGLTITLVRWVPVMLVFSALVTQTALAAESADALYKQCESKSATENQRNCYPAVVKQSEIELIAAEKNARAEMVELENISEGSRSMHPV